MAILTRNTFDISRESEYFSESELSMQVGYAKKDWAIVLLKELIDNALDAVESTERSPEISISLQADSVSVHDNGPGLPKAILERSLDYSTRTSSNVLYVSPTRGQLGNALKLLWVVPYIAAGGSVLVETADYCCQVSIEPRALGRPPEVTRSDAPLSPFVKNGTKVTIFWTQIASYLPSGENSEFYDPPDLARLCYQYAVLNPHLDITLEVEGETLISHSHRSEPWRKWLPSQPTSAHWYSEAAFAGLVGGYLSSQKEMSVRQFITEFDGLKGTQKVKAVMQQIAPSVRTMADLESDRVCNSLLTAMKSESSPVKPDRLGLIGKDHLEQRMGGDYFRYRRSSGYTQEGIPFLVEAAFCTGVDDSGLRLICGFNWSPTFKVLPLLEQIWEENCVDVTDPIFLVLNLSCPDLKFTERGKGAVDVDSCVRHEIKQIFNKVLKDWARHKRQQERNEIASMKALIALEKAYKEKPVKIRDAAFQVMEQAYLKASDNNSLPANARQIMYAARPLIMEI